MLNILIFGENSYIGNAFALFAQDAPEKFKIKKISSRRKVYENSDFSQADCVLFCAGIAHQKAEDALYFSVNCDLALSVAGKARQAGVKQFVYLSSAAVFGQNSKVITPGAVPCPDGAYGKSKLKAEMGLRKLERGDFTITILRPPMVYGSGCRGNFEKLVKLTRLTPVFPDIENRRSMIYSENLCYFLTCVIERQMSGTFFPQNAEPVCTTELVRQIAGCLKKNIHFTRLFNRVIPLLSTAPALNKLFGDFVYESEGLELVGFAGFNESIERSLRLY